MTRPQTRYTLPPMWSWHEFLDRARAPDSIPDGHGRNQNADWGDADWAEALRLATTGWTKALPEVDVSVAMLREQARDRVRTTVLVPKWGVTGSEVDIGAYLAGEPECMIDAVPQSSSTHGRVVTFLIPAPCSHTVPHATIHHRGLALASLCSAIIMAGHSIEIWSGYGVTLEDGRCSAVARVISAAEPLDLGRLVFALAHPAMLRRLWFSVWDSAPEPLAQLMKSHHYGTGPYTCFAEDLPDGIDDPYVLPFLSAEDTQWDTVESAMAWCQEMFVDLGLLHD